MSDRDEESIGKMRTWGHEESARSPQESAWDPGMSIGGLTTRRPEGIDDDGRTDGARRWKAGEEILGRYVVERELGQGGMGMVYGCFDKTGGVKVAVKCLPPELGHNSVEMEEVRENFELVVGLRHPNIAGVRTLERDGRGEYYLVMDVAEGENLRAWLRRKWKAGGVSPEEAVGVLRQVASALDYAHGEKVVHRDVKPGNVMIDGRGRVKVLDFGLAAQIRTSMSRASHVYRGTSGTGPYMAPEQWRGRRQDGKTDQYALGVMAYEMLAGHLPFENDEVSVLREVVLKEEPEDIPGVPEGAMAAIRRALSKSAEERFGSCGAFVEALESGGNGGASTPGEAGKGTSAGTAAEKPAGRRARPVGSPHQGSGTAEEVSTWAPLPVIVRRREGRRALYLAVAGISLLVLVFNGAGRVRYDTKRAQLDAKLKEAALTIVGEDVPLVPGQEVLMAERAIAAEALAWNAVRDARTPDSRTPFAFTILRELTDRGATLTRASWSPAGLDISGTAPSVRAFENLTGWTPNVTAQPSPEAGRITFSLKGEWPDEI